MAEQTSFSTNITHLWCWDHAEKEVCFLDNCDLVCRDMPVINQHLVLKQFPDIADHFTHPCFKIIITYIYTKRVLQFTHNGRQFVL